TYFCGKFVPLICRTGKLGSENRTSSKDHMGDSTNHILLAALYDFVSGNAALDDAARDHIDGCPQCLSDITLFQWLGDFAPQERRYEPPARALGNAQDVFKLKKPAAVTIAKEILAGLIFDSFSEPLPIGMRQRDLPSRQALYKAGNIQLDLKIDLGDERGLLIGQIVADTGDVVVNGLNVELTQGGEVIGQSRTNALGEFIFENLP